MRTGVKLAAGFLAVGAVLLATLPWWLGKALRPLAHTVGADFSDYQPVGYTRFRIEHAVWSRPNVRVEAAQIEADTPLVWLWRHGWGHDSAVAVEGWQVAVKREAPPKKPLDGMVSLHALLGRIARGLERWAPRAALRNGTVSWPGATLGVAKADWERGALQWHGLTWAGRRFDGTIRIADAGVISLEAEQQAGAGTTMRLTWTGAGVAGGASIWAQPLTVKAHFAPQGWMPDEATAVADQWTVPADRVKLGEYYARVRGGGRVSWHAAGFALSVNATAEPKAGIKAPPLEVRAEAAGNRQAWSLTALRVRAPFAQAELSAPVKFGFGRDLRGGPARLTVAVDLSKQPWIEARGRLEGTVDFKESTLRGLAPEFEFTLGEAGTRDLAVRHAVVKGTLDWPRLEFSRLAVQFDDTSEAEASGACDLRAGVLDGVELKAKLGSAWFARWLPKDAAWAGATVAAKISGPWKNPGHEGTAELSGLRIARLKPFDARAGWKGQGRKLEELALHVAADDSTLDLAGAIDARGATLRTLRFAPDGVETLRLAAPATVTWAPVLRVEGLRLQGAKSSLALTVADDPARTFRLEATHLRSDWTHDWIEVREPAWTLQNARATGGLVAGHWSFAAEVEGRIEIQPRPAQVVLKAAGGADGVRLTTLNVTEGGRILTQVTGSLPLAWNPTAEPHLQIDFEAPVELQLKTEAESPLWPALAARLGVTLTGAAAEGRVTGTLAAPAGDLTVTATRIGGGTDKAPPRLPAIDDLAAHLHFEAGAVTLPSLTAKVEGQAVNAQGRLPMTAARWRQLWQKPAAFDWRVAEANVDIPDADMAPLARRLPDIVATQGRLSAHVAMAAGGNFSGWLKIANAATRPLMPLGVVQAIDADVAFSGRTLTVRTFAGQIGGQPVSLQGTVTLPPHGRPRLALALKGKNLPLVRRAGLLVRSDLDLRAETNAAGVTGITGTVNLRDCLVLADLSALLPTGERGVSPLPPYFIVTANPFRRWRLGVEVRGEHSLRARTPVFRGTASAHFQLSGTLGEPRAVGELAVDEGQVLFPFATFDLQFGTVRLSEADPYHPQVNASASAHRYGYDLRMEATGPLESPSVTLTANPALESSQVLLMVMTGQVPPTGVGGASDQQRLARVGAFVGQGLLNNLTGGEGEDRLEIATGREVSLQGHETYQIEYKLNNRWSLVGEYDEFDDYNAGVKWRVYTTGGAHDKK
jgi:translocation and assembly module TamB